MKLGSIEFGDKVLIELGICFELGAKLSIELSVHIYRVRWISLSSLGFFGELAIPFLIVYRVRLLVIELGKTLPNFSRLIEFETT